MELANGWEIILPQSGEDDDPGLLILWDFMNLQERTVTNINASGELSVWKTDISNVTLSSKGARTTLITRPLCMQISTSRNRVSMISGEPPCSPTTIL